MFWGGGKGHIEEDSCINLNYSLIGTALDTALTASRTLVFRPMYRHLSWGCQINSIVSKRNSIMRKIQRSFGYSAPQQRYPATVRVPGPQPCRWTTAVLCGLHTVTNKNKKQPPPTYKWPGGKSSGLQHATFFTILTLIIHNDVPLWIFYH